MVQINLVWIRWLPKAFNFSGTEPVRQGFNAQKIEVQGGFIGIKQ